MLRSLVREDAGKLVFPEQDTYFNGKRLLAAANLLVLADDLGEKDVAQDIARKISDQFKKWKDGTLEKDGAQYFSYDPIIGGLVGYPSSFGSETFNDHHFHYGYFITAAALLGRHDPSFVQEYEPFINLLVRDIATSSHSDTYFPYLRSFDVYEGHSWASGSAPFADGNNQESTSEALQAWYGVAQWAKLIGSKDLEALAQSLYEEERQSTLTYWISPAWSQEIQAHYNDPIVSLLWGGKAEFATWFSPATEAKIGIQMLPLGSQSGYLASNKDHLKDILNRVNLAPGTSFRDSLIMVLSLIEKDKAKMLLSTVTDKDIDTWNTRSYLTAWVLSAR